MNPTRRRILAASAGALAAPALVTAAAAQGAATFPNKPIRIVVPYPAGGQTDGIARSFGDFLARKFGQTVIVENKGGAGGAIGAVEVKRAAPDGYTILCTISSSLIQNRVTVKDLPYDPEKDFTYLTMTTSTGGPVVAAEKTGARNLAEFIAYAKKVDKVNWGAYGAGSTPHVLIETMAAPPPRRRSSPPARARSSPSSASASRPGPTRRRWASRARSAASTTPARSRPSPYRRRRRPTS